MLACSHKRVKTLYNRAPEMDLICRTFWADLSSLPGGRGPDVSLKWSTTCRCVTASQGASLAGLTCRHIGEYQPWETIGDN